jgi:hypothetical protein
VHETTHHGAMQQGESLLERLHGSFIAYRSLRLGGDRAVQIALAGTIFICAAAPFLSDYMLRVLVTIAVYSAMSLGVNLILGLTGQLSLSHAAFFAIGAYASGLLTTR